MGLSVYILLIKNELKPLLIGVFLIQLTLNFLWSIIFFKFHNLGFALIEIILLWVSISSMIYLFYKVNKWAAIINIPYLLWVSFASLLTYKIYILN
jgi:tryptophan-rich sensory protein